MKAFHLGAACGCLLLCIAVPANSADPYIGASGVVGDIGGYGKSAALAVVRVQAGVDLFRYFGVEAQFGQRVTGDTIYDDGQYVKVDDYAAAYGRLILPVSEHGRLYALLGVDEMTIKTSGSTGNSTDTVTGLSYGAGGEMAVTATLRVGSDVVLLNGSGNSKIVTVSAGVRWKFW